ncbi:hypothetical protein MAQA_03666 [Listeria aquatica FSL S10-1188]|uniref:Uncharacterized protein n=1 Tax=Listeria aquatica FSL S10-1188 TaxID=1265818 RepID=W7B7W5_9LIST|nr:hypothetical protein MAQA_03666 [Listeria aquatica FSL S10-1188]
MAGQSGELIYDAKMKNRLKRSEGQIRGILKMMEEKKRLSRNSNATLSCSNKHRSCNRTCCCTKLSGLRRKSPTRQDRGYGVVH